MIQDPNSDFQYDQVIRASRSNTIIDYPTKIRAMDVRSFHNSPFTELDDQEIDDLLPQAEVQQIVEVLDDVRGRGAG